MPFNHGVTISEQSTGTTAPVEATASLPVIYGVAPVNMSQLATPPVNVPVLCYSLEEAVKAFGYSDDWSSFSLCEAMDAYFRQFALAPVVLVNVIDPALAGHKTAVAASNLALTNKMITVNAEGVIPSTVVVKSSDAVTTYTKDTDYTLAFDASGNLVIAVKTGGTIPSGATQLNVAYSKLNPAGVTSSSIIGGVDVEGKATGLELLNAVFPRFGLVPGLVLAPGYSSDPTVAAVMTAKAGNINGNFKAIALTDIPTGTVKQYADVPAWKSGNNYTSSRQVPLWPLLKIGTTSYRYSTLLAGAIGATDVANGGIPYVSPSNKTLKATGAALVDGTEVFLGLDQANYLNSQGIMTALAFGSGGLKAWGNYTGAYPAATDPKEAFLPIRRMFDWIGNTLILTFWQRVDDPANRRLIESVVDSVNIWLNGLTSSGALLGGRVEFRAADNHDTSILAGSLSFRVFITPPGPAQEIEFVLTYATEYLAALTA